MSKDNDFFFQNSYLRNRFNPGRVTVNQNKIIFGCSSKAYLSRLVFNDVLDFIREVYIWPHVNVYS